MQAATQKETTSQARRNANRSALRQAMDAQLRKARQASRRRALRALQANEARTGDAPARASRGTRGTRDTRDTRGLRGTAAAATRAGSTGRAAASGLRVTRTATGASSRASVSATSSRTPGSAASSREPGSVASSRTSASVASSRTLGSVASTARAALATIRPARRTDAASAMAAVEKAMRAAAVRATASATPPPIDPAPQAEPPRARRRRLPRIDTAIIEMGSLHARVTALDLPPRPRIPRPLPAEQDLVSLHRRDWFRILADLQVRGWSNADVGRMLGISDTTVRNWKYGIEPGHARGEALLELHKVALRRKRRVRGGRWGNAGLKGAIGGARRERLRSPQGKRAQLRAEA